MGKLEEMLASGRAPMAIIRGGGRRVASPIQAPLCANQAALERRAARIAAHIEQRRAFAQEIKALGRSRRKSDDRFESVGVVPIEEYQQMQAEMGAAIHDEAALVDELKARGKSFE